MALKNPTQLTKYYYSVFNFTGGGRKNMFSRGTIMFFLKLRTTVLHGSELFLYSEIKYKYTSDNLISEVIFTRLISNLTGYFQQQKMPPAHFTPENI